MKKPADIWLEAFSTRYDICMQIGITDMKEIKVICCTRWIDLPIPLKKVINSSIINNKYGISENFDNHISKLA